MSAEMVSRRLARWPRSSAITHKKSMVWLASPLVQLCKVSLSLLREVFLVLCLFGKLPLSVLLARPLFSPLGTFVWYGQPICGWSNSNINYSNSASSSSRIRPTKRHMQNLPSWLVKLPDLFELLPHSLERMTASGSTTWVWRSRSTGQTGLRSGATYFTVLLSLRSSSWLPSSSGGDQFLFLVKRWPFSNSMSVWWYV